MSATILALDLGATKVAGVLDPSPRPAPSTLEWGPSADAAEELSALIDFARRIAETAERVAAVGVAAAPNVDDAGRVVRWPMRPHWEGVELGAALTDALGAGAVFRDDGAAGALAEADALGIGDVLYIGIGTGVAGGVVRGGRAQLEGPGVEIGHDKVDGSGPECACGRRGCLQAIASGRSILCAAAAGAGTDVDAATLHEAAIRGEGWAVEPLKLAGVAIARAAARVSELLGLGTVVVGGGFAHACPALFQEVDAALGATARDLPNTPVLRAAAHGDRSSLEGARLLARAMTRGDETA